MKREAAAEMGALAGREPDPDLTSDFLKFIGCRARQEAGAHSRRHRRVEPGDWGFAGMLTTDYRERQQ